MLKVFAFAVPSSQHWQPSDTIVQHGLQCSPELQGASLIQRPAASRARKATHYPPGTSTNGLSDESAMDREYADTPTLLLRRTDSAVAEGP